MHGKGNTAGDDGNHQFPEKAGTVAAGAVSDRRHRNLVTQLWVRVYRTENKGSPYRPGGSGQGQSILECRGKNTPGYHPGLP